MRRLFLLLLLCSSAFAGFAQCLNTVAIPSYAELTAPATINGTATSNSMRPDEYLPVNGLVIGYKYKITSNIATDYFTIRTGTYDGTFVDYGVQPRTFTAATSGTYYVHLNTDANCGQLNTVNHNVTITLLEATATPAGCFNTSSLRSLTAPAAINGTSTAAFMLTGYYSPLSSVVSGNYYKLTSTVATDYISVRSGTFNGAIVAAGVQPLTFTAPISGTYFVHVNTDASCGSNNSSRDVTITRIYPPCTGIPSLGTATTSNGGPVCPSTSFNLSVNPALELSNLTYQWEVSSAGATGPFIPIAGKTDATATITGQAQSSWYHLAATCAGSGQSAVSVAVNVTQQVAANCYCIPLYQYSNQYGYINFVQLSSINNITGRNAAASNNYYSYIGAPAANQTTDLAEGSSQIITINVAGASGSNSVAAWIDFNADGDFFDAGEQLGTTSSQPNGNVSFAFTVPGSAVVGSTRLRVREGYIRSVTDPCAYMATYGETEDYTVNIVVPTPCSGQLATPTANGSQIACGASSGTITLTNYDGAVNYELNGTGSGSATFGAGTFSGVPEGSYTITATKTGNCSATSSTVTVSAATSALATPTANGSQIACGASSGTITLTNYDGAVSYELNGTGSGSATFDAGTFSGVPEGSYTITATKTGNCAATSSTVTVSAATNALATPTANGSQIACGANSGTITLTNYDGAVSYELNGTGSGSATFSAGTFSNVPAGSYTITATKTGNCAATSSTVTVSAATSALATPTANGSQIACGASSGMVVLTNYDGAVSYELNGTGSGSATFDAGTFSGVPEGSYTITATKTGNCAATSSTVTVSAATSALTTPTGNGSQIACGANGGTITLTNYNSTVTYALNGTGSASATFSAGTFSGVPEGGYTITATKTGNCAATSSTVTVSAATNALATPTANGSQIVCGASSGNVVLINYDAAVTYLLNGMGSASATFSAGTFSNVPAGSYTITATKTGNCAATSSTVTVSAATSALATPTGNGSQIACGANGGTITLTNYNSTVTYALNGTGSASATFSAGTFSGVPEGGYTITATKTGNCAATSSTVTVSAATNALATPTANGSQIACGASSGNVVLINYDAAVTYLLNGMGSASATFSAGTFSNVPAGSYTITATKTGNCSATSSTVTVSIDQNCGPCKNATSFTTTNVTATSAKLNWIAGANPVQWQVEYKSTAPGAKWTDVLLGGSARSVTISGLKAKQSYNWHMRAKCGTKWLSYSNVITFMTLSSTQSTPIVQTRPLKDPSDVMETNSLLTLHPNPSNGRFIINLHLSDNNSTKAKIELVSMLGQTVYTENGSFANGNLQQTVSMSSSTAYGMYIVRVIANNKVYQQKLVYTK